MQQKDKVDSAKILLLFLMMELGIRWWTRPYFGPLQEFVLQHKFIFFLIINSLFIIIPLAFLKIVLKKGPSYFGITFKNRTREMTYVFFVAVVGEVALFAYMKSEKLAIIFGDSSLRLIYFGWAFEELIFGFNQELMYRSILQGELNKWIGMKKSLIISSIIFTLGPLHWDQLSFLILTFGVFVMGLFSGWLYNRYQNVIIPGVCHGIANSFMLGITYTLQSRI